MSAFKFFWIAKSTLIFLLSVVAFVAGAYACWLLSEQVFIWNARLVEKWFSLPAMHLGARVLQVVVLVVEVCLVVALAALYQIRYRRPRVFISFKHTHEGKAQAAAAALEKRGFRVLRLPFGQYTHDEIVGFVRDALRQADALVAIPDAEHASFVDAELMGASVRRIPIVLLQYQERQFQPTTLLRGYPVFDYHCLQAEDFAPLYRYLAFAAGHPAEYGRMLGRIFSVFFDVVSLVVLMVILLVFVGMEGAKELLNRLTQLLWHCSLFAPNTDSAVFHNTIFILLLLGYAGYLLYRQWQVLRTARQISITGADSFQTFADAFSILKSDRMVLRCIRENNFIPRGK